MYDELIKKLYHCANEVFCNKCPYSPDCAGEKTIIREAADAIERLDAIAQTYVETVHEIEDKRKWIPVTERLPEENTDCLVFIISGEFGQLSWMSMAIFCNGVFRYDDHCGEFDQITHWMPLPQPPEDGET